MLCTLEGEIGRGWGVSMSTCVHPLLQSHVDIVIWQNIIEILEIETPSRSMCKLLGLYSSYCQRISM